MQIEKIKNQICDVCHKMWQLGWVAANDGNVSVRLEDGTFLATPTGMSKPFKEIAQETGLKEKGVASAYYRSIKKLRAEMGDVK